VSKFDWATIVWLGFRAMVDIIIIAGIMMKAKS